MLESELEIAELLRRPSAVEDSASFDGEVIADKDYQKLAL